MASLKLIPWLVGSKSGREILSLRPVATNAVQFFRLRSVNKFAHSHLTSNGLIFLLDSLLFKINKIGALLQEISISSSKDHDLSLSNSAPGKRRETWASFNGNLFPSVCGSIILFNGLINKLRDMLVFSLSLALNSSIDINHIIELRNSEISPLIVHIVQTVPLDINFVFWILFVSKVWVEQESAVVANY